MLAGGHVPPHKEFHVLDQTQLRAYVSNFLHEHVAPLTISLDSCVDEHFGRFPCGNVPD
jgi:hypothetical protein